jgi:hypothetical protein
MLTATPALAVYRGEEHACGVLALPDDRLMDGREGRVRESSQR